MFDIVHHRIERNQIANLRIWQHERLKSQIFLSTNNSLQLLKKVILDVNLITLLVYGCTTAVQLYCFFFVNLLHNPVCRENTVIIVVLLLPAVCSYIHP